MDESFELKLNVEPATFNSEEEKWIAMQIFSSERGALDPPAVIAAIYERPKILYREVPPRNAFGAAPVSISYAAFFDRGCDRSARFVEQLSDNWTFFFPERFHLLAPSGYAAVSAQVANARGLESLLVFRASNLA
ncbi:MAG: hypothetical protein M3O66_03710 [Verrucomicrobiota bacterium]|nr:hypothetical protein [Verrucomicrobiota bacterium]